MRDVAGARPQDHGGRGGSGWTADRLGAVERNILRIAIQELERGRDPARGDLDEAVTLAKQYAFDDAGRLVNGILDQIVKEEAA